MWKNRINRPVSSLPPTQGYKDWETGETHKPLNNSAPRVGIAKWKRHRKCKCSDCVRTKKPILEKVNKKEFKKAIEDVKKDIDAED